MKMKGYRATHRNRWLLIERKIINLQEFSLFEYLIDAASFHKSNDNYGVAEINVSHLAMILGYESSTSVYTKLKKLDRIGLISKAKSNWSLLKISNFTRYLLSNKPQFGEASTYARNETNQSIGINSQFTGNESHLIGQKSTPLLSEQTFSPLSSFNVNSFTSTSSNDVTRDKYNIPTNQKIDDQAPVDESFLRTQEQDSGEGSRHEDSSIISDNLHSIDEVTLVDENEVEYQCTEAKWKEIRLKDPTQIPWADVLLIEESVREATPYRSYKQQVREA